jgi:hypothetical protein
VKFFNLFKPIKSPVGEVVGDEAFDKGVEYMSLESATRWYRMIAPYEAIEVRTNVGDNVYRIDYRVQRRPFADWLEAQGVRLL